MTYAKIHNPKLCLERLGQNTEPLLGCVQKHHSTTLELAAFSRESSL